VLQRDKYKWMRFHIKSIAMRITAFTGSLLVISLIVLSVLNYQSSARIVNEAIRVDVHLEAEAVANELNAFLNSNLSVLHSIAKGGSQYYGDSAKQLAYVKEAQAQNSELTAIIFTHELTGKLSTNHKGAPVDISARPFMKDLAQGKLTISDPVISTVDGSLSVILGSPLMKDKQVVGSFTASLPIAEVTDTVARAKFGQTGYAMLFDSSGKMIYHPIKENIMKSTVQDLNVTELTNAFMDGTKGGEGILTFSLDGQNRLGYYHKVANNWVLVLSAPEDELLRPIYDLRNQAILISVMIVIVGLIASYIISSRLSKPIVHLKHSIDIVAGGNLSHQTSVTGMDEIGQAGVSFNTMVTSLKSMVLEVYETSHQLAASSQQLLAGAEQSSKVTEHIAGSAQTLAEATEQQFTNIQNGAQTIDGLSGTLSAIADRTKEAATSAVVTSSKAKQGEHTVTNAVVQMESVGQTLHVLAASVHALSARSIEIGNIVNMISSIAQQTNILSLNASIEAARAGETGRGFAVVAAEIRKLAELTGQSAKQISELISVVQRDAGKAKEEMNVVAGEFATGAEAVSYAGQLFGEIVTDISSVSQVVQEIEQNTQYISDSINGMVTSIHSLADIAAANNLETQSVSAATEEQLASMEEVTASANALSKMADELNESVSRFKL
jgi:methyl-accepting chemotaxis protein